LFEVFAVLALVADCRRAGLAVGDARDRLVMGRRHLGGGTGGLCTGCRGKSQMGAVTGTV
jgi:hypothetical protein